MFFDDVELISKRRVALKEPPPVPETGWRPPTEFPNLSAATVVAFDVETKEYDDLDDYGPGWARGRAHIVGYSLAVRDAVGNRGRWYFPIRHEVGGEDNLPADKALAFLKHTMATPVPKVGANLLYDVGNCAAEGVDVQGPLHDIQFAEGLLDDTVFVGLDHLAKRYLGEGKETSLLYDWINKAYNPKPSRIRGEIYRAPPRLVGPYGEQDADLPLRILDQQWPLIHREGLGYVYRLECDLIKLMAEMRFAGISVDLDQAHRLYGELSKDIERLYAEMCSKYGVNVTSVGSPDQLVKLFDSQGIPYLRTEKGAPSFQKEWMKALEHPLGVDINKIREYEKIKGTFLKSYILEKHIGGKVYPQFHLMKGDDNGTKTGRLSSSDPNLQNIPIRSDMGKKLRRCFIKDAGHLCWEKDDYSQIEYRELAHFAVGPGSEELRAKYNSDPKTDYHDVVQNNVKELTGLLIDRRPIKNINFGLLYGQSEPSLSYKAGFTPQQGKDVFKAYHLGAPYVRPTMRHIAQEVQDTGYVRTIIGRRVKFDLWEPAGFGERARALPLEAAIRQYGQNIKRAGDYKAVNYKFQGSGTGDTIKIAMRACYQAGVFNVIGVPRIQVHDELGFSVIDDSPLHNEAYAWMRRTLETALPHRIPIRVDSKRGAAWGDID